MKFLENSGKPVCLLGQLGSGKTSIGKQVYMSVSNTPPLVIQNHLKFDVGIQPIIFDNEFIKEITDVEKDQLKDKIKT